MKWFVGGGGFLGFWAAVIYYQLTFVNGDEAMGLVVTVPAAMLLGALLGWAVYTLVTKIVTER